jgi:hypothetical protein
MDNFNFKVGDLVKTLNRFGVVLHIGKRSQNDDLIPYDAVWCIWEKSEEDARKSNREFLLSRLFLMGDYRGDRPTFTAQSTVRMFLVSHSATEKKQDRFEIIIGDE